MQRHNTWAADPRWFGRALWAAVWDREATRNMKHVLRHPIAALENWWEASLPKRRLDHNIANMCMLFGLSLPALSIMLLGPTPTSALRDMSEQLQVAMCTCIFVGCVVKLHGALCHTRFYFPNKPLRHCYQIGYRGAPVASAGLFVYGYYLIEGTPTWTSAVGTVGTTFFAFGVLLQGGVYWLEARRLERLERHMINIAKQVKEIQQ